MFPRFGRNRDAGRTRWWKLEGIDRFSEIGFQFRIVFLRRKREHLPGFLPRKAADAVFNRQVVGSQLHMQDTSVIGVSRNLFDRDNLPAD